MVIAHGGVIDASRGGCGAGGFGVVGGASWEDIGGWDGGLVDVCLILDMGGLGDRGRTGGRA